MTRRVARVLSTLAAVALAAALAAACGIDEHYTGMGTGAVPGDKLYPQPDPGPGNCQVPDRDVPTADAPPLAIDDLSGKAYRFDTMALGRPLPDSILPLVNDTVTQQLDEGLINVLLAIDTDDREAGTLAARLGTGPKPAGTAYAFEGTPQAVAFALTGSHFQSTADASLSISVALGEEALVLPIQALRLQGTLAADGSAISGGTLTGAISEEDAATVMIPLFGNLKDFLASQEPPIPPDTTVGPDKKPAWSFEASFTAASATMQ